MSDACPESTDDRQRIDGYRFKCLKRVYEDDAAIAFIDLLGTGRLWEGPLPAQVQAQETFRSVVGRFDVKFGQHFPSRADQLSFDVSIFADSIVVSERRRIDCVPRLVEFLLDYQEGLLVNDSVPSQAVLVRGPFFSLKFSGISRQSILGSPHTSISLCGGRGIMAAHKCLKGLPIGVYVTPRVHSELTDAQRARIVPVRDEQGLSFVKMEQDVLRYLPPETEHFLHPEANRDEVTGSSEAAFRNPRVATPIERQLGIRDSWEALRPGVQADDPAVRDKWMQWILIHLGKQDKVIRQSK